MKKLHLIFYARTIMYTYLYIYIYIILVAYTFLHNIKTFRKTYYFEEYEIKNAGW